MTPLFDIFQVWKDFSDFFTSCILLAKQTLFFAV